ncbi:GHKL domain-containing protein [Aequorivita sp. H23M31]|uniref:histidine kinase n=1 Tax=Aequorivita ciconiae TaxID=2494375 RepID=A0A410G1E7_9FLAO|nr:ATP-binding protein [Aequorivita sp. H23M31]QAA81098.1 GHKL domain-containing protein [Aequorivita sp. H23M31]
MKRIRKIGLTNFILLISSLILVIILIAFSFTKNAESATAIAESWQVKNNIRRISSSLSSMESKKLAYIYTGQIKYKKAFDAAHQQYDSLREVLTSSVSNNKEQTELMQKIEKLVEIEYPSLDEQSIAGLASESLRKELNDEIQSTQKIQEFLEQMTQIENVLLQKRNDSYDIWMLLIIVGIVTATLIVGLSLYNLIGRIQPLLEELLETKNNLEDSNRSLNVTLEKLNNSNHEKELEIRAKEKAIQETEMLNDSLRVKNQQLDHFAYVASHDLQEPLRTVSNYLEVFQEDFPERLEGEATMYFDFINSAVDRMRNLISGLLSFSRIGTSGEIENIDLNETITKIKEDLSSIMERRGILIENDLLPIIKGYKIEIKQLFQNLISNAIKFTAPEDQPHIKIDFDETENFYNFHIKDNGIGIPDKDYTKIFDMFSRLHSTKDYEGQGIGLAFCKKIVELHHGNIWVTSEFGKGSTIHFTIGK